MFGKLLSGRMAYGFVIFFAASVVKADEIPRVTGASPEVYRGASADSAQATLNRLRQLVAEGAISQADILQAAQGLHPSEVQRTPGTSRQEASSAAAAISSPSLPERRYGYTRTNTRVAIQISGALTDAEFSQAAGELDRHSTTFLRRLRRIEFQDPAPASGEAANLGTKVVDDSRGVVTLYSKDSLEENLAMGIGAHMFDYGLSAQEKGYWKNTSSRAEYIFAYADHFAASNNPFVPTIATAR